MFFSLDIYVSPSYTARLVSRVGPIYRLADIFGRYRGVRGKGTDRRAAGLPLLYKRALERLDRSHHNTAPWPDRTFGQETAELWKAGGAGGGALG